MEAMKRISHIKTTKKENDQVKSDAIPKKRDLSAFAAHIRDDGTEQSVYTHLTNVGKYCRIYAGKIGLKSCGELIGVLHDMGKLTESFNAYIHASHKNPEKNRKGPDHSTAGALWSISLLKNGAAEFERITGQIVSMVIMWHHGGLGDVYNEFGESDYLKRLGKLYDNQWNPEYLEAKGNFEMQFQQAKVKDLFKTAAAEIKTFFIQNIQGKIQQKDLKYAFGLICKYLYSCLVDADRYDTATFMDGEKMDLPQDNCEFWKALAAVAEGKLNQMDETEPINVLRRTLSDTCALNAARKPGIYELNCPTGSGKTLSALRYALRHAAQYKKERIFYIVPLISIIDQNSAAIKEFLKDYEHGIESVILELHSGKEEDPFAEKELKRKVPFDESKVKQAERLAERMDAPIVITTMVRFLNTFFKGGTKNPRPIHSFANSIIVFDEIQTLPIKCMAMFNTLINFLAFGCGATIILSTATQPGLEQMPKNIPALKIVKNSELSGCTREIRRQFRRVQFNLEMIPKGTEGNNSVEEVTEKMRGCLEGNLHILGVFNTKKSALKVYEALKICESDDVDLYFLSTDLCPAHRKDILNEIKEKMKSSRKIIVISTQLIEAGVDLDFDVVFRALAGLDSLIQTAGRCNRHGRKRLGTVFLIKPDFEDLSGLAAIQKGKESSEKLIRRFTQYPEEFDYRIDSEEAISWYYRDYFSKEAGQMKYPFEEKGIGKFEMYKLLNMNQNMKAGASRTAVEREKKQWAPVLYQSFKLAGRNFEPIDTVGRSVLVPYKEGKEIIEELREKRNYSEKKLLLRQAQQYCVNVTEAKYKKIQDGVTFYEDLGILVLSEAYYDPKAKGLVVDPVQNVLLL